MHELYLCNALVGFFDILYLANYAVLFVLSVLLPFGVSRINHCWALRNSFSPRPHTQLCESIYLFVWLCAFVGAYITPLCGALLCWHNKRGGVKVLAVALAIQWLVNVWGLLTRNLDRVAFFARQI